MCVCECKKKRVRESFFERRITHCPHQTYSRFLIVLIGSYSNKICIKEDSEETFFLPSRNIWPEIDNPALGIYLHFHSIVKPLVSI